MYYTSVWNIYNNLRHFLNTIKISDNYGICFHKIMLILFKASRAKQIIKKA